MLVGPWPHMRPHEAVPGPRIDWVHEMARFFAETLRGEDTGFMKEPPVTVYMQEYATPERTRQITPGSWRSETRFPAEGATELTWYLGEGGVLQAASPKNPGRDFDPRVGAGDE